MDFSFSGLAGSVSAAVSLPTYLSGRRAPANLKRIRRVRAKPGGGLPVRRWKARARGNVLEDGSVRRSVPRGAWREALDFTVSIPPRRARSPRNEDRHAHYRCDARVAGGRTGASDSRASSPQATWQGRWQVGPNGSAQWPMTPADASTRPGRATTRINPGIIHRHRKCVIERAPPRRPRGRRASVGRAPEGRSHTPYHHGVWDRPSVTLSDPENRGAAGQGKSEQGRDRSPSQSSREWKLEFGMEEARERRAGGGEEFQAIGLVRGAGHGQRGGGVGEREELSAEVSPGSVAGARVKGEPGDWNRFILTG